MYYVYKGLSQHGSHFQVMELVILIPRLVLIRIHVYCNQSQEWLIRTIAPSSCMEVVGVKMADSSPP